jgi:hypothetical protein
MHQNKARLEFNKDNIDDKYNFIISKVTTLEMSHRPHAVSKDYQNNVGHLIFCYHHTHSRLFQLGYN